MSRVDEINAQIAKLEAELESAMMAERANVLEKMRTNIKLYGFKTSDFKGILVTRSKRGSKPKTDAVTSTKRAYTKKAK